jgi:hypothetical protein
MSMRWIRSLVLVLAVCAACRDFALAEKQALGGAAGVAAGGEPVREAGGAASRIGSGGDPSRSEGGAVDDESENGGRAADAKGGASEQGDGPSQDGGAGQAGSASQTGGVGGDRTNGGEEPFPAPPFCETVFGHPPIGLTAATDIAVAKTIAGLPIVAFTAQPTTQIVALSWQDFNGWTNWACFDAVPQPRRVAAGNHGTNGRLQVYAVSDGGGLFARQATLSSYDAWRPFPRPSQHDPVLDIAVVDGATSSALYSVGATGIFARTREPDENSVVTAGWQQVDDGGASRVAVGVLPNGSHDLLVVTWDAQLLEARQMTAGENYLFSPFADVSEDHAFVDVDFGLGASGAPCSFGVQSDGSLVSRAWNEEGWDDWQPVAQASNAPHLKSLAIASHLGEKPTLFAVSTLGIPYFSLDEGVTWQARIP